MISGFDIGIDGLDDFEEIGAGGFATVYAALEVGTRRRVAVKVLAAVDDRGRRRFDREQQTMGQTTDHTNIVTLFRTGYTNPGNNPFLVMEYMAGGSLQDRIDSQGPVAWDDAVALIRPVADALGYSHNAGIVHKDVKPANILVSATGVVKLSDFGVSAVKEATATSQVAYSLVYTSPETFDAEPDPQTGEVLDPRDERSDLYSLAATLYVLGVGKAPFDSPSSAGLMSQILNRPVPTTHDQRVDLFLAKAMAKDPAARYQNAAEFVAGLDEHFGPGNAPFSGGPNTVVAPPANVAQWPAPNPHHQSDSGFPNGTPFQAPAPANFTDPGPSGSPYQAPATNYGVAPQGAPQQAAAQPSTPLQAAAQQAASQQGASQPYPAAAPPNDSRGWVLVVAVASFLVIAAGVVGLLALRTADDNEADTAANAGDTTIEAGQDSTDDPGEAAVDEPAGSGNDAGGEATSGAVPAGSGGELELLQWQAPSQANALASGATTDLLAASLVTEPLARFDPSGDLVPTLAVEIPTVANGGVASDLTSITWPLREGVLWSDGSPFTADDVVFTWEYCSNASSDCAVDLTTIDSVVADDDLTVTINFIEPTPFPYGEFVGYRKPILQRAQFADCVGTQSAQCDAHNLAPIGTGPFMITEFVPESTVSYEFNPNYRGVSDGKPFFGSVLIRGGGTGETTARSVLESGEADFAWNVQAAPDTLATLVANSDARLVTAFAANVEHINLNQTDPEGNPPSEYTANGGTHPVLFENGEFARALSLAIDREAMVSAAYGPLGAPACVLWPVGAQRSTDQDWCLVRDVDEANRILDELGYLDSDGDGVREFTDGTPLEFDVVTSTNEVRQSNQEIIQENWAEIGVVANMRDVEPLAFFDFEGGEDSIWTFRSDMSIFTNGSEGPDPFGYLRAWTSDQIPTSANAWLATSNVPRMRSQEFDASVAQLTQLTPDDLAYLGLVRQLQDIQVESGAIIPLIHRGSVSAVAPSIEGIGELNGWDSEYWNIEDWSRS